MARVSTSTRVTRKYRRSRSLKNRTTLIRRRGRIVKKNAFRSRYVPRLEISAYPRTKLVKHRYVENIQLPAAAAAGLGRFYVFRANSMYDPNYTGSGHQPLYRDQMALVYKKYTVIASYIKVIFNTGSGDQQNFGINVSDDVSTLDTATPTTLMEEHPSRVVGPYQPNIMNKPPTKTASFDAKRWFKTSLAGLLADDVQNTQIGNDPTRGVYYQIWTAPVDPGVTLAGGYVQVQMNLICLWREPSDATQS